MRIIFVFLLILGLLKYAMAEEGLCYAPSVAVMESKLKPLYWKVDNPLPLSLLPIFKIYLDSRAVFIREIML